MIQQIMQPFIREESGGNNPAVQKDPLPEASGLTSTTGWLPGSFVYTSGTGASVVLNKLGTAGTVVYGQSPDGSVNTATPVLPTKLFGLNHYPFDVRDRIIEINITGSAATIGTTNGATYAGGGTNGVALAAGQQYGVVLGTGSFLNYQLLDVSNTTQKVFEIVGLANTPQNPQTTTDNNPRVLVKVIASVLQG